MLADDVMDLRDPAFVADPYPVFDRLRGEGRAVRHDGLGLWLAVRHADADAVLRERRLGRIFREREPADVWETFNWLHADSILDCEPPKHTRLRALVAKAFARGHVERLRPRVRELADGLLDDAVAAAGPDGVVDLVADYAEPLPVMVIAELLGVPEPDRPLLRPWSQDDREDVRVRPHPRAGGRGADRERGVLRLRRRAGPRAAGRTRARTWSPTWRRWRTAASGSPSASSSPPACCC